MKSTLPIGMVIIFAGLCLVVIGFVVTLLQNPTPKNSSDQSNVKVSVVGLIGPFPIGFSNDKQLFFLTLLIAFFLMVLGFIFLKKI